MGTVRKTKARKPARRRLRLSDVQMQVDGLREVVRTELSKLSRGDVTDVGFLRSEIGQLRGDVKILADLVRAADFKQQIGLLVTSQQDLDRDMTQILRFMTEVERKFANHEDRITKIESNGVSGAAGFHPPMATKG